VRLSDINGTRVTIDKILIERSNEQWAIRQRGRVTHSAHLIITQKTAVSERN
jgi:hypothetical protein